MKGKKRGMDHADCEKSGRIRFDGEWDREFYVSAGELARMQGIVREFGEQMERLSAVVKKWEAERGKINQTG